MEEIFTPAALSMGLLELIKLIIRWRKGAQFDFPLKFYAIMLPILNVAVIPFLVWLKAPGYSLPKTWQEYVYGIIVAAVGSFLASFLYNGTVKPAKAYLETRKDITAGASKRGKLESD